MGEILRNYDVLGAFWMTIYLAFFSAIGALVIGTIMAVMRVSPVGVLRWAGTTYVNIIRNTPLTLILVFCSLGILYILQVSLADEQSPTSIVDNNIRWAIVGLAVYHAAFDGKLVITTSREGISDLRADDGRLADDEAFKAATEGAGMPDETTGFLYVDLEQALPILSGLMGFSGQATPDWLDRNLEPLQSLVLYGERDSDVARLVGLLSIQ